MGVLTRAIDILLYTNIWIAGSASALFVFTHFTLRGSFGNHNLVFLLLTTCTWLYTLHRFIGLGKVETFKHGGRFQKIKRNRNIILGVGIISFLISIVLTFTLIISQFYVLAVLGILSMLYVLPVFKNGKRLRDINYVKIFIISLVWAGLTVLLPSVQSSGIGFDLLMIGLFLERFLFIFAITLPFDIRDLDVDRMTGVRTIAANIGERPTYYLSASLLILCSTLVLYLHFLEMLDSTILSIHLICNLITIIIIGLALRKKHDWYFTGALDGVMYLPFLLLVLSILI